MTEAAGCQPGAQSLRVLIGLADETVRTRVSRLLNHSIPDPFELQQVGGAVPVTLPDDIASYDIVILDAVTARDRPELKSLAALHTGNAPAMLVWTPLQLCLRVQNLPIVLRTAVIDQDDLSDSTVTLLLRQAWERVLLARSLRSSDRWAVQLVESLPSAVYVVPASGARWPYYMSTYIEELTGYPVEKWYQDPLFGLTIIHPDDREQFRAALVSGKKFRQPAKVEYRYVRANGQIRWVRNEARVIQDPDTGEEYWHGVIYDISPHKAAEAALAQRERNQAALARLAYQSVRNPGLDELLQFAVEIVAEQLNVELCKILRFSEHGEEFVLQAGVGWHEGLVGRARVPAGVDSQAGYTLASSAPVVVKDLNTERRFAGPRLLFDHGVVSGTSVPIHGSSGPYGVLGAHSTTSREFLPDDVNFLQSVAGILASRIEREARDEELRFQASLLDAVDQAVIATDLRGNILYWSRSAQDLYGWERGEVQGRNIVEVTPSDMSRAQAQELMKALRIGESWSGEFKVRRRDGVEFWTEVTDSPIYDRRGNLIGIVGISHDVTERRRAADALREAEIRYRSLVEQIPAIVFTAHPDDVSHLLYQSPQIESMLGYTAQEWLKDPRFWLERVHPDDRPALEASDEHASRSHEPFVIEYRVQRKDGRSIWLRDSAQLIYDHEGAPLYWQGVSYDVTQLKEAQHVQQLLASVVTSTNDAIFSWSQDRTISSWNRGAELIYGFSAKEVLGVNIGDERIFPPGARSDLLALAVRAESGEAVQGFETELRRSDGREISVSLTVSPIVDEHGVVVGGSAIARDVTDRKRLERQLIHQAFHDPLTGLPNRALFLDRLSQALQRAERRQHEIAVLFIDLDNFKVVNDSLGHARGDELLIAVAERLRLVLRDSDSLARMGGDEFTVLLEELEGPRHAENVVRRLFAVLEAPFLVGDEEVRVTASIGIALSSDRYESSDDLVRGADTAMYRAKSQGKGRHAMFDQTMHARALERLQLEQQLRRAIERGELELHYQPFWSICDGQVCGVEALVRWRHPQRGLVYPDEFLWIAEETGLILDLDSWVLRTAMRQCQTWGEDESFTPAMQVSVNLSGRQFQQNGFDLKVGMLLEETRLEPERLILEITESDVMADPRMAADVLASLKRLGVGIAVDDFGTGYSSLAHLKRFPIDYVKIDKNFIGGMTADSDDVTLVAGLIRLSQEMGMQVIAEGVETEQQLQILRDLKCDLGQGFLRYRPVPQTELQLLRHAGG